MVTNYSKKKKMKKTLLSLLLICYINVGFTQISKAELQASGLTCSMCNLSIKKSLEKIKFIDSIVSSIETASYILTFKQGEIVDFNRIKNAVESAGFTIGQLSFVTQLSGVKELTKNSFTLDGVEFRVNEDFNSTNPYVEFYITNKGFLNEKRFNKFKNTNSSDKNVINISTL